MKPKTTEKPNIKLSLLVPCYNEEKSVEACIKSCLHQTRPFDEIIFIDDSSKDGTPNILKKYEHLITIKKTPQNLGNKSHAQEYGLQFVTGDVVVTTDADTKISWNFAQEIEKEFEDPTVAASSGYVKSLPYNWLTLCRAFDYVLGQNIHKLAQSYMNYIFVMPGAASAFRVDTFRKYINFDHDTITEDLDFTYKLHKNNLKVTYTRSAITYTQDPTTLKAYINQMRRWYGGGWQNLVKHWSIVKHPVRAYELALNYSEGVLFSLLLLLIPILNPWLGLKILASYFVLTTLFAIWAAHTSKRPTMLLVPFVYLPLVFINSYIYLEQFVKEVVFRKKNLTWFQPERFGLSNK